MFAMRPDGLLDDRKHGLPGLTPEHSSAALSALQEL
jgi:hypothetical protein